MSDNKSPGFFFPPFFGWCWGEELNSMKTELSSSTRNLRRARNAEDFKNCSLSRFIIMRNEVLLLMDRSTTGPQEILVYFELLATAQLMFRKPLQHLTRGPRTLTGYTTSRLLWRRCCRGQRGWGDFALLFLRGIELGWIFNLHRCLLVNYILVLPSWLCMNRVEKDVNTFVVVCFKIPWPNKSRKHWAAEGFINSLLEHPILIPGAVLTTSNCNCLVFCLLILSS